VLNSDSPLRHPAAAFVIAATAQQIATHWDGVPVPDDSASVIEAHLKPKMLAVLDSADSDSETLLEAINELARAYADATSFLKPLR